jgi:exodeoxyribonuclease VII small subunit
MPDEPLSYADAVAELEAIVTGLDDADVDVDVLAERVARAAELIALCRERISATRLEVERIVTQLDEP